MQEKYAQFDGSRKYDVLLLHVADERLDVVGRANAPPPPHGQPVGDVFTEICVHISGAPTANSQTHCHGGPQGSWTRKIALTGF